MAADRASSLSIAILAAGEGKRMRSGVPKVLHPLGGRPLLAHVVATARKLEADRICVVYGHGGNAVRERFPDPDRRCRTRLEAPVTRWRRRCRSSAPTA